MVDIYQKDLYFVFEPNSLNLVPVLEGRLPISANVYNMCKVYDNFKKPDEMAFYIMKTGGKELSNDNVWILATFFREDYGMRYVLSAPPGAQVTSEVKSALIHCPYINWNEKYCFSCIDFAISPVIYEISTIIYGNSVTCMPCKIFYMDKEQAASIHIAENKLQQNELTTKSLNTKEGIDYLVQTWKYAIPGKTSTVLESLLCKNKSLGLYDKTGKVICGLCVNDCGLLGMLYTLEEHRGKGLAMFVTRQLLKSLSIEVDAVPCSGVEVRNLASAAFHDKLGMKVSHGADWIKYSPTTW